MAATTTTTSSSSSTTTTSSSSMVTSTPSTVELSPRSPNNHRGSLPSPWAQVVRGAGESSDFSESSTAENVPVVEGNVGKKPAWNKPANAISPPLPPPSSGDQAVVMGAASWPALSESTRLPLKSSSSSDSPKSTPDVSISVSQEPGASHLQSPKQGSANANPNSSVSAAPTRHKSMKHGGGNRQGGFPRGPPPPPPPQPAFPNSEMVQGSFYKAVPVGGVASHPNSSNDLINQRSTNRRGNFMQHGRGDGRNNRHDHDHANHSWGSSTNPHGRGAHGQPHRPHGRGFMGPPVQGALSFLPQPIRPYGNPLIFHDPAPLVYYIHSLPTDPFRGVTYLTGPPPPPYIGLQEPLHVSIVKQIEYYFSDANLVKDGFLRRHMDEQGWVPITLIAGFPRMKDLTEDLTDGIPYILDCLRASTVVEVQGDKVRRCNEWMKWIAPRQPPLDSIAQSSVGSKDLTTTKELNNTLRVSKVEGSIQGVC